MAYRRPERPTEPKAKDDEEARPTGLGSLRSKHGRGSGLTRLLGRSSIDGVLLHSDGIVVFDEDAGRTEMLFAQIDSVFYDVEGILPSPPRVILSTFDGRRATIPRDIHGLARVLDAIDLRVTQPLVEPAKRALARGERLTFGPLTLVLDGIELRQDSLEWSELALVAAEHDAIIFYARGDHRRFGWLAVRDVPHPRVLLEVLRKRTKVVSRGTDPYRFGVSLDDDDGGPI
jgi:hypothetical protein